MRLFSVSNVLEMPEMVKALDVASFPKVMKRAQMGIENKNILLKSNKPVSSKPSFSSSSSSLLHVALQPPSIKYFQCRLLFHFPLSPYILMNEQAYNL